MKKGLILVVSIAGIVALAELVRRSVVDKLDNTYFDGYDSGFEAAVSWLDAKNEKRVGLDDYLKGKNNVVRDADQNSTETP